MAFPKDLRLQLGLSLAEFADLLSTNVGQLSMAESGLRSLPAASLQITSLLQKAAGSPANQLTTGKQPAKKTLTLLTKELRKQQLKMNVLENGATKLAEKLSAAKYLLAATHAYAGLPAKERNEEVGMQMAVLERKARKKIETLELKQIQAQLSIAGLQATIEKLREWTK